MFNKLFKTKPHVKNVNFSIGELIGALNQRCSASHGQQQQETIHDPENMLREHINTYNQLKNLNIDTAKENYSLTNICIDLYRNKPEIKIYKNKKQIALLGGIIAEQTEGQLRWLQETMESLAGEKPIQGEYFSYLAGQNVTNSGGNMVELLCKSANVNWIPQFSTKDKSATISADENGINYFIKIPIRSIKNFHNIETPVIANLDSPIGYVSIHLQVSMDKQNQPCHRITYSLESNNEEFRKKIVQPLYDDLQKAYKHGMKTKEIETLESDVTSSKKLQ
ncbi:hypothetical protein [Legionella fallonii]|uniref:Uncharacterized protein n=1 Tax=Legionella fallonii LLAP-10 TaxID=1212491 RepID=A0A098G6D4_9GAMM|nr:hypothetical protein [Legionella fallonii]CEG57541.1 protein of unknown function [coiled-coil domain] [Legionella fallonii LLAP-10]